jgi:ElaB/YqjD/DUF883 family membrane-anchored ribosome-binding protein
MERTRILAARLVLTDSTASMLEFERSDAHFLPMLLIRRAGRRLWSWLTPLPFVVPLLALLACGAPSLDHELDSVASWTQTVRLAAERRRAGATSKVYTSELRDRAAEALESARQSLGESARSEADRTRAAAALDSLGQEIHQLDAADAGGRS